MSRCGGMADATDSKSVIRKGVRVRVSPPALNCMRNSCSFFNAKIFYIKNIVSNRILRDKIGHCIESFKIPPIKWKSKSFYARIHQRIFIRLL